MSLTSITDGLRVNFVSWWCSCPPNSVLIIIIYIYPFTILQTVLWMYEICTKLYQKCTKDHIKSICKQEVQLSVLFLGQHANIYWNKRKNKLFFYFIKKSSEILFEKVWSYSSFSVFSFSCFSKASFSDPLIEIFSLWESANLAWTTNPWRQIRNSNRTHPTEQIKTIQGIQTGWSLTSAPVIAGRVDTPMELPALKGVERTGFSKKVFKPAD